MLEKNPVEAKRPSKVFLDMVQIFQRYGKIVGADVLRSDFRPNIITYAVVVAIVYYFVFTITTIVSMFKENWKFMLEALCMSSSVIQGIMKLITVLGWRKSLVAHVGQIHDLYDNYESDNGSYRRALSSCSGNLKKMITAMGVCYLIAATIVMLPAYVMPFVGSEKRVLIMHFHLPGLDIGTDFGFWATLASHTFCFVLGCVGLYVGDCIVLIFFFQAFAFGDIFKLKMQELNDAVSNAENNELVDRLLVDLVEWHQFYMDFNRTCNDIFYYILSSIVGLSGSSIVLTIFIILKSEWHGAIPYLIITVCSLYIYCILGTRIEICNENVSDMIYNISWYNMTVTQQKIVLLMKLQAQHPVTIDVAGVLPLSVTTALQITKTVYSITMMLLQFD